MLMKASKPLSFVLLAFLIGAVTSQIPFAFADSSANPLQSIWDAINSLSSKQENMQAQIDELRATIESERSTVIETNGPQSEASIKIEVEGGEKLGSTIVHLIAYNAGPDNAVGVKVTFFYEMQLFEIESTSGEQCEDLSRGIIQCFIGTIASGEQYPITIVANSKVLDEKSNMVVDVSSITTDTEPSNNHVNLQFITGEIPKTGLIDSEDVATENENGSNGIVEGQDQVESAGDSQTIRDDQSSEEQDTQNEQTENNSNSTQFADPNQQDESMNQEQQAQGSDGEGSEDQNSAESTGNGDSDTQQASQTQSSEGSSADQSQQGTQEESGEGESPGDSESSGSEGSSQ